MRKSTFIKHLSELDSEELKEELISLYDKLPQVRDYYKMDLGSDGDRKNILDNAKKEIAKRYVSKSYRRPRRPRIQKVNRLLSETKKKCVLSHEMIDVYLFTAETAVGFIHEYSFYSTVIENNIVNTFERAIELIVDSKLEDTYQDRSNALLKRCQKIYALRKRLEPIIKNVDLFL